MSKRDRTTVHVDFIAIEAELFFDREILRREGFVDFDQVNVVERQSSFLQNDLVAGTGPLLGSTPAMPSGRFGLSV